MGFWGASVVGLAKFVEEVVRPLTQDGDLLRDNEILGLVGPEASVFPKNPHPNAKILKVLLMVDSVDGMEDVNGGIFFKIF